MAKRRSRSRARPRSTDRPPRGTAAEVGSLRARVAELEERIRSGFFSDELVRSMAEGLVIVSPKDSTIIRASERFERMLGYGPGELEGRPVHILNKGFEGATPERVRDLITARLVAAGEASYEIENVRKDGSSVWCYAQARTVNHPELGDVWVAVHMDITALRKAQEEKRKSENLFRSLFRKAPVGVALGDIDNRFIDVNDSFCRLLGYSRRELLERTIADITLPEDRAKMSSLAAELLRGRPAGHAREACFVRKDDSVFWASVTAAHVEDDQGKIIGMVVFVEDISDRRRAIDRLRAERDLVIKVNAGSTLHQTLALCLDASIRAAGMDSGGIYLFESPGGRLVLKHAKGLSPQFESASASYPATSARARLVRADRPVYGDYRELGLVKAQRDEGLRSLAMIPLKHQGLVIGCINLASHSLVELAPESRETLESAGAQIALAVSRAKGDEDLRISSSRLRALAGELARAQEAERRWLAREIHDDIGQALTALGMSLESINFQLRDECPQDARRQIKSAVTQLESINERIRGIISGLYPPILEDYGLADALRWYGREYASRTGLKIVVRCPEGLTGLSKEAETGLFRIAQEALTNVVKHAGARIARVTLTSRGSCVRLSVRDDGKGLSAEPADGRFHWGLMSMRERAAGMGGTFQIGSEKGRGTSVVVTVGGG